MNTIVIHPPDKEEMIIDKILETESNKLFSVIFRSEGKIEVDDGYHTMSELYQHRFALFVALCNFISHSETSICAWKSKLHSDGEIPFNDPKYFVAGISLDYEYKDGFIFTPKGKQITYHMKIDPWWNRFKIPELVRAPEYDGHTSDDVIERLLKL